MCIDRESATARGPLEAERQLRILYYVHNVGDPAVARRASMLVDGGAQVVIAGFRRGSQKPVDIPGVEITEIGASEDGRLGRRVASVAKASMQPLIAQIREADLVVARNLEMLAVALAHRGHARVKTPIVYECLDIHRLMLGDTMASAALRRLEARLMKKTSALIVSSPAFVSEYFAARHRERPPVILLENKILEESTPIPASPEATLPPGPPWIIGWFGMVRCRRSLGFLASLLREKPGLAEVDIRGLPSYVEFKDFDATVASVPGMRFHGRYGPLDLPRHYGACHFAWAIDSFEEGLNSTWLLPNRLYESLANGAVPIALRSVETGRWLEKRGVGLLLDKLEDLPAALSLLTAETFAQMRARVRDLDRGQVVSTRADSVALVSQLQALAGARSK